MIWHAGDEASQESQNLKHGCSCTENREGKCGKQVMQPLDRLEGLVSSLVKAPKKAQLFS